MNDIHAIYEIASSEEEIEARAFALALEQSVELPIEAIHDEWVMREVVAQVAGITPSLPGKFRVTVRLKAATVGKNSAQFLNMLFGNCSLQEDVTLVDIEIPPELAEHFGGPRFGIQGLREATGVHGRPLSCAALKPQGLPLDELASLAETLALAGIDIIKDDHGFADQTYADFPERVRLVQQAIDRANATKGESQPRTLYAPSLVGNPLSLWAQVDTALNAGVGAVMLAPMLIGLPVFHEIASSIGLPVLAHPAFGGGRIAMPLLIGKLFRLFGADAVIFPNHGGRFAFSRDTCEQISSNARDDWNGLLPALPVPAGGMTIERIPEMATLYGRDSMFLIGGNLLKEKQAIEERAVQFVNAVSSIRDE
jgi:ribulose-bisphosphate carboxylase large chain